jgi:hypothetical protein
MRRIALSALAVVSGLLTCGCDGPGWYRAVGHYPGVAPSDYAFYDFLGTSSQLYPFSGSQVETSAREALGDLGFKIAGPPEPCPDGGVILEARTPDGRSARVTVSPQNNLTNMRIKIGPVCVGDEMLSRDVFRRVALNLGTLPRDHTPLEPVLSRRINAPVGITPHLQPEAPETLEGEGLRPGDTRGTVPGEGYPENPQPLNPPSIPNPYNPAVPFVPTRDNPNPPNLPYAPFPYSPYEPNP